MISKILFDTSLRTARKLYPVKYSLRGQFDQSYTDTFNEVAGQLISQKLREDKPLMISRFGSIELSCVTNYLHQKQPRNKYMNFITGKTGSYEWEKMVVESMCIQAGFFPKSLTLLEKFSELYLDDMNQIDILGSWLKEEQLYSDQLQQASKVGILNLEPYNHHQPWSQELRGKKVLVIHPYDESIRRQYQRRHLLFSDPLVLPEFELATLRAVQSIGENGAAFPNWFDALDSMKEQVAARDFDIAIIGCGAYGLPLAAFVKRLGKKAVHLGGATQLLFGIKGKRWENNYLDYKERLINTHWVRPLPEEVPGNFMRVENGCYW